MQTHAHDQVVELTAAEQREIDGGLPIPGGCLDPILEHLIEQQYGSIWAYLEA